MPGDSHRLLSNDKIVTDDRNVPDVVSVEYLNEVDVPGTPPHKLHLKLGSLISFIRNTRSRNFDSGLVNGRKGIIRGISRHVLDLKVIADGSPLVKVPRTCFEVQVGGRGIAFHRVQFLVRSCHARTKKQVTGTNIETRRVGSAWGRVLPWSAIRCS